MPSPRALVAAALLLAIGAWPDIARGRTANLVAGRSRLFAIDDAAVVTFDDAGRPIARCDRFAPPPAERAAGPGIGAPEAEDVLRAAGLPTDDLDSTLAEDLLDNEGLRPIRRRRTPPAAPPIELRALAADPMRDEVWIGSSAGLYRADADGCSPRALAGRDVRLVAAAGAVVAAATDDLLWRFDATTGSVAGVSGLVSLPRALAIASDGQTLVGDGDGLLAIGPDGAAARLLARPIDALAACAGLNAALADDGVYVWADGGQPVRLGARPPARTLACGPGAGPRWLAAGVGLWRSADGDDWADLPGWRGLSIAAAATVVGRVWLIADGMLLSADADGAAGLATKTAAKRPSPPRALAAPAEATTLSPLSLLPWPQVTVLVAGQRTTTRAGWSAVVLLTFPLSGRRRGRSVAAERARRDGALAAEEVVLSRAPMDDDEREARLRAARQEREALR